MKTKLLSTIIAGALLIASPLTVFSKDYTDEFFNENPTLTAEEKQALEIAKSWQAGSTTAIKPIKGARGEVNFVYGTQQANIVCAVLQVCDVALQPGEQVNNIFLGDTARWTVDPGITGSGPTTTQHLIIKPLDVALETSLVVTTDRRTYHIKLRSHRTRYMPKISFSYPGEIEKKWSQIQKHKQQERVAQTIPQTGEYLGDLSFDYDIKGNAEWKPVRVYNNGEKTMIEMPKAMSQTEAPTLLVVRKDGGFFTDEETTIVNYRLQKNRYIVDSVFNKAILITGVGSDQQRITITRSK